MQRDRQRQGQAASGLTAALFLHLVLALGVGVVALVQPEALLVYAAEAQARACAGCEMAFDLARAFGALNLLAALLAARFLVAARFGRDYTTPSAVAHGRVLLVPMGLSMLLSLLLRLQFIASGRFATAEWVSAGAAAALSGVYLDASCRAPFV
ncbi:hypothetical protein pqer_cds_561 [Pandoravirus quercus]|uniref:Uncharacterized protein n=2 Tax=Pandoravirus TaxID=2060084 RepID=A0A2U7U963_9VIRU|nr:hypothetical protein pqer_cds_561 [Pandoravirus quercus]AVK74983.1 hypothetical protein pqer_cds_561 [Pandoravirus quercus]QBZ81171.1 hypothetical protein pclt_cds_578 [Pandoravirus celtis]